VASEMIEQSCVVGELGGHLCHQKRSRIHLLQIFIRSYSKGREKRFLRRRR
jgi:hypothetical protein